MRRAFLKQIMSVGALAVLGTLGLGCAGGLGAARSRLDKNPTVAVVVGESDLSFFKGIYVQDKHAPLPKEYDAVTQAVADAVKAGWPGAKVLPINEAAGADLEFHIYYAANYTSLFNKDNSSEICGSLFRVEPKLKVLDAKTRVQVAGVWSLGVISESVNPSCEPHGGLTIDQMMEKKPPADFAATLAQKVAEKSRSIVADIKAAKPE
jgi:hypothetical protein